MLTTTGLLSRNGFKRALDAWPKIDFIDDHEGCLFTATVHRKKSETSVKTSVKILDAMRQNAEITLPELANVIGVTKRSVERSIQKLQQQGRLRRIGPDKGGHWEVIE